jgi:hypothetical protein
MHEKSTPPEGPGWKFVTHAAIGDVETCLWHRRGSNQFGWRPVEKQWGAVRKTTEKPVTDFIKILIPHEDERDFLPLLANDL